MKIPGGEDIRDWDAATIAAQGGTSLDLMERAATACVAWLSGQYSLDTPFVIVCGTGNNGGDGLAIARLLITRGFRVLTFVVRHTSGLSPDCVANLEALQQVDGALITVLADGDLITELPPAVVVIDALFGTGLNRPVTGYPEAFIRQLNALPNAIVAIDMPSGLPADEVVVECGVVVQAVHTLTFQQYKRAMLHPENGVFCGQIHLLDIELDKPFQQALDVHWHTLDMSLLQTLYRPRRAFSHKGTYGTAFLIGGSYGMMGAILLAAGAAGRAGAGKVQTLVPECGYDIMQTGCLEAMCQTTGSRYLEKIDGWESAQGIGIGPGMGTEPATVEAFAHFLQELGRPAVFDADALNILAAHRRLLQDIPGHSILTPHPKELERLAGKSCDSFARADLARSMAMEHQLIVIAKDRHTLIALPDGRCYYNTRGNAGLATGGSGDVLCGILTGLLAQGYEPEAAALLGVYLHAAAADDAIRGHSMESLVAGDLLAHIGAAYRTLA